MTLYRSFTIYSSIVYTIFFIWTCTQLRFVAELLRALEEKRARLGLVECVNHELLQPYPVLHEKPGRLSLESMLPADYFEGAFPDSMSP